MQKWADHIKFSLLKAILLSAQLDQMQEKKIKRKPKGKGCCYSTGLEGAAPTLQHYWGMVVVSSRDSCKMLCSEIQVFVLTVAHDKNDLKSCSFLVTIRPNPIHWLVWVSFWLTWTHQATVSPDPSPKIHIIHLINMTKSDSLYLCLLCLRWHFLFWERFSVAYNLGAFLAKIFETLQTRASWTIIPSDNTAASTLVSLFVMDKAWGSQPGACLQMHVLSPL